MIRPYKLHSDCPFDNGFEEVWKDDEDGEIYYSPADIPNYFKQTVLDDGEVVFVSPYEE